MKVCTKCGRELPEEMFHKDKTRKDGLQTQCKECQRRYKKEHKDKIREYHEKYYQEHKEEYKEQHKKYYQEHKEERSEHVKKYYQEHREEKKEQHKKYKKEHKDKIREHGKQYYQEHKEERLEYSKKYYQTPRGKSVKKAAWQNRRVRKKNNGGSFTVDEWLEVCEKFNNECAYCGKNDAKLTADHIVPVSKGGHGNIDNIISVCQSCNSSKNNADLTDWYPAQSFFTAERYQKIIEHAHLNV